MDSERPIEKALRKLAAKRQAEQGERFELHPATRRLLQGEVSRQYANPKASDSSSWTGRLFGSFTMRLAWSASFIVVLGLFLVSELTHRPGDIRLASADQKFAGASLKTSSPNTDRDFSRASASVAKAEKTPMSSVLAKSIPPTEPLGNKGELAEVTSIERVPSSPEIAASGGKPDKLLAPAAREGNRRMESDTFAPAGTAGASLSSQAQESLEVLRGAPAFKTKTSPSLSTAQPNVAAPAQKSGFPELPIAGPELARETIGNSLQNSQQFVAEHGRSKKAAEQSGAVLDQFSLSQQGSQLRVQDMDGSIYLGEVVLEESPAAADKTLVTPRKMRAAPGTATRAAGVNSSLGADNYYFKVSGTNRSLNRRVIFTGRVETTNEVALDVAVSNRSQIFGQTAGTSSNSSLFNNQQYRAVANQMQMNLQNSRLSGTAEIEGTKNVEIRAVPAR